MKVRLIGKRQLRYTKKETGVVTEYGELFYTYKAAGSPSVNYEGVISDKVYIGYDDYDDIPIDCDANLEFDNRGRFVGVELL